MAGYLWNHTAVIADSNLIVSLVVGQGMQEQTHALVYDAKRRLRLGHLSAICTATYTGYGEGMTLTPHRLRVLR
jgi:hypothetical protein